MGSSQIPISVFHQVLCRMYSQVGEFCFYTILYCALLKKSSTLFCAISSDQFDEGVYFPLSLSVCLSLCLFLS